jgi:hypothetical protein
VEDVSVAVRPERLVVETDDAVAPV